MIRFYGWLLVLVLCASSAWGANPFASDSQVEVFDSAPIRMEKKQEQTTVWAKHLEVPNNIIAVMADLHARPENAEMIKKAFSRINSLSNLYGLVIAGDLCSKVGSPSEYKLLGSVLEKLTSPVFAVPGNHDLIYRDNLYDGNKKRATPTERKEKQRRFKKMFGLKSLCYSKRVAGHLLIFLPNDSLSGTPLVLPSDKAYDFLRKILKKNRNTPTIVFCHAPLAESYGEKKTLAPIHANLQPAAKIKKILDENPQVYLWFAGHLHITPGQEFYNFKGNKVGKTNVIHVPPVKNDRAWVQTVRLLPNGAIVRTMDVKTGKFMKKHNRVFAHRIKAENKKPENQDNTTPAKNLDKIGQNGDYEPDKEEEQLSDTEEESDTEDFVEVDSEISELEEENVDTLEILINSLENDFATGTIEL
ncbi:MAG: metallophosphoesterase [Candidatus Riflebacteria bacterium]